MNKPALLTALATFLRACADAFDNTVTLTQPEASTAAPAPEGEKKRTRGPNKPKDTAPEPVSETQPQVVNAQPEPLTADTIKTAWAPLVKIGKTAELKAFFTQWSPSISQLDPQHYPAMMAKVQEMLVTYAAEIEASEMQ